MSSKFKSTQKEKQPEYLKDPMTMICQERVSIPQVNYPQIVPQTMSKQHQVPEKSPNQQIYEMKEKSKLSMKSSNTYQPTPFDKGKDRARNGMLRSSMNQNSVRKSGYSPSIPQKKEHVTKEVVV